MLVLNKLQQKSCSATPLMLACKKFLIDDVQQIIQQEVDNAKILDRSGKSALHYCVDNSKPTCAEILLKNCPSLLNLQDEEGYTALHLSVISGNVIMTKFLLDNKAELNLLDKERHSALHWSIVCGEVTCFHLLLSFGAEPNIADINGAYPIHYASQICEIDDNMKMNMHTGLYFVNKLILHNANVDVKDNEGRQPLIWASSAENSEGILSLIKAGAKIDEGDKEGLTGTKSTFRFIMMNREIALHCAASRGHSKCLEELITFGGANIDVIDKIGCTALFYAVTMGHADCVDLLLRYGAEFDIQDRKGRTAAHCGCAKGQLETIKILEKFGANLWVKNIKGDYPLHDAVHSGRKDLVKWFLSKHPKAVHLQNNDGRSCLHIACFNNDLEMCKILINNKIDVNSLMNTNRGQVMTPLDVSLFKHHKNCTTYLYLHGGLPFSKLKNSNKEKRCISSYGLNKSDNEDNSSHIFSLNTLRNSLKETISPVPITTPISDGVQTDDLQLKNMKSQDTQVSLPTNENYGIKNQFQLPNLTFVYEKRYYSTRKKFIKKRNKKVTTMYKKTASIITSRGNNSSSQFREVNENRKNLIKLPTFDNKEQINLKKHIIDNIGQKDNDANDQFDTVWINKNSVAPSTIEITFPITKEITDYPAKESVLTSAVRSTTTPTAKLAAPITKEIDSCEATEFIGPVTKDLYALPETERGTQTATESTTLIIDPIATPATDKNGAIENFQQHSDHFNSSAVNFHSDKTERSILKMHECINDKVKSAVANNLKKAEIESRLFLMLVEIGRMRQIFPLKNFRMEEKLFVKKMVITLKSNSLTAFLPSFSGPFNFRSFEKYLHEQLWRIRNKKLRKSMTIVNMDDSPKKINRAVDVKHCVNRTHRCHHCAYSYTGVPCAAYCKRHLKIL